MSPELNPEPDSQVSTDREPNEALVVDDLIEEVSIDGMCGVY